MKITKSKLKKIIVEELTKADKGEIKKMQFRVNSGFTKN